MEQNGMSWNVHMEGQGAQSLEALNFIRETQAQVMKDYYENIKQFTTIENELTKFNSDATVNAAMEECKAQRAQGTMAIGGGIASIGITAGTMLLSTREAQKMKSNEVPLENIGKSLEVINTSDEADVQAGQPRSTQPLKDIKNALIDTDFTKERFTKQTDFNANDPSHKKIVLNNSSDPSSAGQALALLKDEKTDIEKNLNIKKDTYERALKKQEQNMSRYIGLLNSLPQSLSATLSGGGQVWASGHQAKKGVEDALAKTVQANQQVAQSIDQMSLQGAQGASQNQQSSSQSFQTIISSETQRA